MGNTLIRSQTSAYLQEKSDLFIRYVTDLDFQQAHLPILDLSALKVKCEITQQFIDQGLVNAWSVGDCVPRMAVAVVLGIKYSSVTSSVVFADLGFWLPLAAIHTLLPEDTGILLCHQTFFPREDFGALTHSFPCSSRSGTSWRPSSGSGGTLTHGPSRSSSSGTCGYGST